MASSAPLMPFLRPLAPPRPSTIRHFLRFSTTRQCNATEGRVSATAEPTEDPNLIASRSAASMYPPPSMRSDPRPKVSRASQRTSHAPQESPARTPLNLSPIETLPDAQCAPNLPYFISRTGNQELPVYHDRKRGGNQLWTLVKKVDGKKEVLRDEIRNLLERQRESVGIMAGSQKEVEVKINALTGHIKVKGWHKDVIVDFLRARKF